MRSNLNPVVESMHRAKLLKDFNDEARGLRAALMGKNVASNQVESMCLASVGEHTLVFETRPHVFHVAGVVSDNTSNIDARERGTNLQPSP